MTMHRTERKVLRRILEADEPAATVLYAVALHFNIPAFEYSFSAESAARRIIRTAEEMTP